MSTVTTRRGAMKRDREADVESAGSEKRAKQSADDSDVDGAQSPPQPSSPVLSALQSEPSSPPSSPTTNRTIVQPIGMIAPTTTAPVTMTGSGSTSVPTSCSGHGAAGVAPQVGELILHGAGVAATGPPTGSSTGGASAAISRFSLPPHVEEALARRIAVLADHIDLPSNCYPVGRAPRDIAWGGTADDDARFTGIDLAKTMCKKGMPVKWRFVCSLHSAWMVSPMGEPHKRVNLGFKLFRPLDLEGAQRLLFHNAKPAIAPEEPGSTMYAARLMYRRAKGELTPTVQPFERVYDAREGFRPKALMPMLPAASLGKGDIVVIEAYLTRWKTEDTEKGGRKKRGWVTWNTSFELLNVSLLKAAPEGESEAVEVEGDGDFWL